MNNFVKVFEASVSEKSWFEEILDDNNIPYTSEIISYWEGPIKYKKYCERKDIYVAKIFERQVLEYINEYNNPNNFVHESSETFENYEDCLPKIKCSSCGKEFDIDYPKCPFCKTVV